ncbi:MAG: hypothetical protein J2P37_02185 [Ktedonobacteraceae bacterium]|nr:hypothetical protein [Ktedonobacteraceae bacterium]
MSDQRNYITWIDRETNEQKSLIGELLDVDQIETGGANKRHIEGLQPYEQYAIFMSMIKRDKKLITSVDEMFETYIEYSRERGRQLMTREEFVTGVMERSKVTPVRIGDKDYFIGVGLKKNRENNPR